MSAPWPTPGRPTDPGPAPGPVWLPPSGAAPPRGEPVPDPSAGPVGLAPGPYPSPGPPAWTPPTPPARPAPRRPAHPGLVLLIATVLAVAAGFVAGAGGGVVASRLLEAPASTPSARPTGAAPAGELDTAAVAAKVLPSSVTISVNTGRGRSTGSGFVLDERGHVITNHHVVANAVDSEPIRLTFNDGQRFDARVVGRSPGYDLAVLQVDSAAPIVAVETAPSSEVRIGQPAIAVGSPLGLGGTVTEGIVSALNRPVVVGGNSSGEGATAYINAIQTDAPINPGNSGGMLVNAEGHVIGVNSAILSLGSTETSQAGNIGVGFAIPITQATQIAEMLIKDGRASYPTIGANVANADDDGGAAIVSLTNGSPAAQAGLRVGDVLTRVGRQPVTSMVSCIVALRSHRPGDVVRVGYQRDGAPGEVEVTLSGKVG